MAAQGDGTRSAVQSPHRGTAISRPDSTAAVQSPAPRDTRSEIAVGAAWSTLTWVVSTLAGPVLVVALVRRMTRTEYGSLATASSAIGLASVLVSIGMLAALTRYTAVIRVEQGRAGMARLLRQMRSLVGFATAAALAVGAGLVALTYGLGHLHSSELPTIAFLPSLAVAPVAAATGGFLRGAFRPRWIALAGVAGPLAAAGMIAYELVRSSPSAWEVAAARSGGAIVTAAILGWGIGHWRAAGDSRADAGSSRGAAEAQATISRGTIIRFGMAMQLSAVFATAVSELGVIVLGATQGAHSTAAFAPPAGIAATVLLLPGAVGGYLLSGLSPAAARGDHREVQRLFHWASKWNVVLAAPALAIMVVCPADVLRVLFGAGHTSGADALRILGIGCTLQVATGFNELTLSAFATPALITKVELANVGAGLVCVATLIPPLGIAGAAYATTGALAFSNLLVSGLLLRRYHVTPADGAMLTTIVVFASSCIAGAQAAGGLASGLARCTVVAVVSTLTVAAAALFSGGRADREQIVSLVGAHVRRR